MCRYDVDVISPRGEKKTFNLSKNQQQMTVAQLKKEVLKAFDTGNYFGDFGLVFEGKPVEDDCASLSDCKIKHKSVVQMVTKVNGG